MKLNYMVFKVKTKNVETQKTNWCYPPETDRINKFSQLFITSVEDVLYSAAVRSELLHSSCCHLIFSLTGQHEGHQHLETSYLWRQQKDRLDI